MILSSTEQRFVWLDVPIVLGFPFNFSERLTGALWRGSLPMLRPKLHTSGSHKKLRKVKKLQAELDALRAESGP